MPPTAACRRSPGPAAPTMTRPSWATLGAHVGVPWQAPADDGWSWVIAQPAGRPERRSPSLGKSRAPVTRLTGQDSWSRSLPGCL